MTVIYICIVLAIATFFGAAYKQSPAAMFFSVLGMVLTGIGYFNTKSSELEKALVLNAPIECKGVKYSDYMTKDGLIVVDSKAFKKHECSAIELRKTL